MSIEHSLGVRYRTVPGSGLQVNRGRQINKYITMGKELPLWYRLW